ncbi:MAG: MBL fold metallo-hydrolase [Verrucomicrobia bacterium]|nr:MBL fold metallo-hydrolase [Verrucomicrobiota bacterium]
MMHGNVIVNQSGDIRVHTYTAPEEGWLVNSHLIELHSQLLAVDAQYMLPFAQEVVKYAATLGKPITRLYLTHYHPDHILGAVTFKAPIYALPEVRTKITAAGDRVAKEEHKKHRDAIVAKAERPNQVVVPGEEMIDGVPFEFLDVTNAETEHALMVGLPEQSMLITQDLIYSGVHAFVGEKAFDSWSQALHTYREQPYTRILPGHGSPGGQELYDTMLHYLTEAKDALASANNGPEMKARLTATFPNYSGQVLLDHQERFLFPKP